MLPKDILSLAEEFLALRKVVLPSRKMLERQVGSLCAKVHSKIFETIYERIPSSLKRSLNEILSANFTEKAKYHRLTDSDSGSEPTVCSPLIIRVITGITIKPSASTLMFLISIRFSIQKLFRAVRGKHAMF